MKQTLTNIQVEYDEPITIYCDNKSVINISKNLVMHSKTKHITIKYHFLWEQVAEKNIRVEYVGVTHYFGHLDDDFTRMQSGPQNHLFPWKSNYFPPLQTYFLKGRCRLPI
jgi:hypothetical protein